MSSDSTADDSESSSTDQGSVDEDPRTVIATVALEHPPERIEEHELSDADLTQELRKYIHSEGIQDADIEVHHAPLEEIDTGSFPSPAGKIEVVDIVRDGHGRRTWLVDRTALEGETVEERLKREYSECSVDELRIYEEGPLDQTNSSLRRDGLAVLTG